MGSCLTLSNIPSEETRILTTQETLGKGLLDQEQQAEGAWESCSSHGSRARVCGSGVSFRVISGQSSCSPKMCGGSGSFLWCTRDSADVDSNVRASGKLAGCFVSPLRLLALPEFLRVRSLASPPSFYPEFSPFVSGGSSVFLIRPSVVRQSRHAVTVAPAEAGGFHPRWPRSGKRASKQSEKIGEDILEEVRFGLRF